MTKYLASTSSYTFSASARTITFVSGIPSRQALILSISRARGGLLYQSEDTAYGGTWVSPTLTLLQDTTTYSNSDDLRVWLDDGQTPSSLQSTGNTSLANIDADLGAVGDTAATTDTGSFSVVSLIKRGLQNWTTLLAKIPTLTLSGSRLLVDNSGVTQPVSATALPLPSGAATDTNQQTANTSLDNINQKLPALASGRVPVDIGSASVSIGASVEISNDDGNPLPVSIAVRTPSVTSIASSATSVTILASNASRRGLALANDSTSVLRLAFATPATSANAFVVMQPGQFLLLDPLLIGTGAIYGIWASANGTAQVTEWI